MIKKIFGIIICTLLITTILPLCVNAGDEENPEIEDDLEDTDLGLLDIESAWFYEKQEEPDILYTVLKIKELKENFNAVYSIEWYYNNIEYTSGLEIYFFKKFIFRSGMPKRATYWQWKNMPECEGIIDEDNDTITWKILKSNIGKPQTGDVLTKTRANAVPGFPLSFIYFLIKDVRDFAPNSVFEYGREYVIQY